MLLKINFTVLLLLSFGIVLSAQTISVKEVARLETKIKQTPDDFETRSKLISYYGQGKTLADKKSLQRHRLGLIQSNPQKASSSMLGIWWSDDKNKPEYIELRNEWLKQLAKFKTDYEVRVNAGDFMTLTEPLLAEKIFLEGEAIDANIFWYPLRLLGIYNSKYEELLSNAEINDEPLKEEDTKPLLAKIIAQTHKGVSALENYNEPTKDELLRKFLAFRAMRSLDLGDSKGAYDAAHELHKNLAETKPKYYLYEYFRIVLSVKGRSQLMEGNLVKAKEYLFDSLNILENTENLPPIIDTKFIEELLVKEGAQDVLQYLKLCEKLNLENDDRKIIKKWRTLLLSGRVPKFSEYRNNIESILLL